ncbi:hypothetical protein [Streptomyces canus]|uniref:hypothetical protein n=1 Tax=Streptomyces canus TaxID=58343 RepID=UPI00371700D8
MNGAGEQEPLRGGPVGADVRVAGDRVGGVAGGGRLLAVGVADGYGTTAGTTDASAAETYARDGKQ